MRQITIFGATGFLGRHIVKRLAKDGWRIIVPTRDPAKALFLRPMGDVGQIVPLTCQPHREDEVVEVLQGSNAAINLIGILFEKGTSNFQSAHVETAARIARVSREQGVSNFVQISAIGADRASASQYARSKAMGEEAVRSFFPEAVILRPSIVFGPEDGFFNLFASLARFSPFLPLIGGGHTRFQPVYVGDVAEAVTLALKPESAGQSFELGGPQIYTFRALLELMLRLTNRQCGLVSLPWPVAYLQASLMEVMPRPLLTRDQVKLLRNDNVVSSSAQSLYELGVSPTALEIILPGYLARYRRAA